MNLLKPKTALKLVSLFILVAFIVYSCKKDNKTAQQTVADPAISLAKQWYQSTYPVSIGTTGSSTKSTNSSTNSVTNLSQVIQPDWQHPATYARLGKNVI